MNHIRTVGLIGIIAGSLMAQNPCGPAWDGATGTAGVLGQNLGFAVFDDGGGPALYAAGDLSMAGSDVYAAKWNGSAWIPLHLPNSGTGFGFALCVFDDGTGPALYLGGTFTSIGGVSANNIAKWDGSTWTSVGGGVTSFLISTVRSMIVFDDGTGPALFVGGTFGNAGGVPVNNIAKWDGATWSSLSTGMLGGLPYTTTVTSLAVFDDDGTGNQLFAGGAFSSAGGTAAEAIAKWNGSAWSAIPGGPAAIQTPTGLVTLIIALKAFDAGAGPALYAGGLFTINTPFGLTSSVAALYGSLWLPLGGGIVSPPTIQAPVYALEAFDDGTGARIYAGGEFASIGGAAAASIASWDGSAWNPLGLGVSTNVTSMVTFDDGEGPALHVGGTIGSAGGANAATFARWSGLRPRISLSQLGGAGSGSVVTNLSLLTGNEYYNIFSLEQCTSVGTGPYLGLCAGNIAPLLDQVLLPLGTPPFHFVATGSTATFGPYQVPAGITVEAVCFDVTGGVVGCVAPVRQLVVQ